MPLNVIVSLIIEFNSGATTSYVPILGTETIYYKSSTTRDSQCLLVAVLSSILSTFCMTTLFQTMPESEILLVFCSQSLFYSVSWEKGLMQRSPGARMIWEICFSPWKGEKMDLKRSKRTEVFHEALADLKSWDWYCFRNLEMYRCRSRIGLHGWHPCYIGGCNNLVNPWKDEIEIVL